MNAEFKRSCENAGLEPDKVEQAFESQLALQDAMDLANYATSELQREYATKISLSIAQVMSRFDYVTVALMYAVGAYTPANDEERKTLDEIVASAKTEEAAADPSITRFKLMEHLTKAPDYEDQESIKNFQDGILGIADLASPKGFKRGEALAEEQQAEMQRQMEQFEEDRERFKMAEMFSQNVTPIEI